MKQKRFFFQDHDERLLKKVQKRLGLLSQAEVIRFVLRRLAEKEGVKV